MSNFIFHYLEAVEIAQLARSFQIRIIETPSPFRAAAS